MTNEETKSRDQPGLKVIYTVIAVWMFAGLLLGEVLYSLGSRSWVLITEIVEIGAFVAFWVVNLFVARRALIRNLQRSNYPSKSA